VVDGRRHGGAGQAGGRARGRVGGARGRARRHGRDERDALDWRAVAWFITGRGEARRGCGSSVGTTFSGPSGLRSWNAELDLWLLITSVPKNK